MFERIATGVGVLALGISVGSCGVDNAEAQSSGQSQGAVIPGPYGACAALPSAAQLLTALSHSVKASGGPSNGGLDFHMWATVVNRQGVVCSVVKSGNSLDDQWLGSRVISAQKANTANAFSLGKNPALGQIALSTANLYSAVQPGGSLFGLQHSNPVNTDIAYGGRGPNAADAYGTASDPLVGQFIGGVNVFGGGFALYDASGKFVGGLGVSGDTSCADHNVGWRVRRALGLDHTPGGVGPNHTDGIHYLAEGEAPNGFKHPLCGFSEKTVAVAIGAGG